MLSRTTMLRFYVKILPEALRFYAKMIKNTNLQCLANKKEC